MLMQLNSRIRPGQSSHVRKKPRRNHIEDLAVLPVFFNLAGKKVLVAGGSDAAAWKVELLSASGAIVHVATSNPSEEMDKLFEQAEQSHRQIVPIRRDWLRCDFDNATLAVGDFNGEQGCRSFVEAGRSAGVLTNIIDKPDHCQFQFGSIINRSPVVISISTNGAAPILGQAIRRHIETVIPQTLAGWAKLAQRIRPNVMKQLPQGRARRNFWERFVDLAFSGDHAPTRMTSHSFTCDFKVRNSDAQGQVTFVDVSHGESDLLPMRAVRMLQSADVILYGDGVNPDILELARREARHMSINDDGDADASDDGRGRAISVMMRLAANDMHIVRLIADACPLENKLQTEMLALQAKHICVNCIPTAMSPPFIPLDH